MKNTTKIGVVLAISIAFFGAEIAIGFKTKSLALIADAFHYLNDIVAYAISFAAAYLQERGQHTQSFTYAFQRAELVGAFFNGVFLLALALSILLQSIERFVHVQSVDSPKLVLIVGSIGLLLNITSALVVHDHHRHGHGHDHGHETARYEMNAVEMRADPQRDSIHANHNHTVDPPIATAQHNLGLMGVFVHLLGDATNNIGVIVAAVIFIKLTSPKRFYADPAVSLAISMVIFASAIPMTLKSGRMLLEASPIHLDLAKIKKDLVDLPKVQAVHDLHVWHLSQSDILGSLHVCVEPGTSIEEWETTERMLQHCFGEYGINHVTISPEISRDYQALSTGDDGAKEGCRLPSHDDFGCVVGDLKKRKTNRAVSNA